MTDLLFSTDPTPPSELQAARLRFQAATAAYNRADALSDETGEEMPYEVECEYFAAKEALYWAEDAEVQRLKQ